MTNDGLSMVNVSFKCPQSLWERVKEYAAKEDRDYSSVCRLALSKFFSVGCAVLRRKGRPNDRGQEVRCL